MAEDSKVNPQSLHSQAMDVMATMEISGMELTAVNIAMACSEASKMMANPGEEKGHAALLMGYILGVAMGCKQAPRVVEDVARRIGILEARMGMGLN